MKGAIGEIKFMKDDDIVTVSWAGSGLGIRTVRNSQISKCSSEDFLRVGDVVEAIADLTYEDGKKVMKGAIGEIKFMKDDDIVTVSWAGSGLGIRTVRNSQ